MSATALVLPGAITSAVIGLGAVALICWIAEHPDPTKDPLMHLLTRTRRRVARAWMAYWRDVAASTPRRHLMSASDEFPALPRLLQPALRGLPRAGVFVTGTRLRDVADTVANETPRTRLRQLVKIALLAASARGQLDDPTSTLLAIEGELARIEAEVDDEVRTYCAIAAKHLHAAADELDDYHAEGTRQEMRLSRAIAEVERAAIGDGFDPRGWFVYTLWAADDVKPLYVGMSGNVLARLGQHMGNPDRRHKIERVTLIACRNEERARQVESRLIRKHQPPLNVVGVG